MTKINNENLFTHITKKYIKIIEKKKLRKKIIEVWKFINEPKELSNDEFKIIKIIAPIITGILKRFEYSTENCLWKPKNLIMVKIAPDLLTPGISARHWKTPIRNDIK